MNNYWYKYTSLIACKKYDIIRQIHIYECIVTNTYKKHTVYLNLKLYIYTRDDKKIQDF